MLNRQSRTLFLSGIMLTVFNFMPSFSITFILCAFVACFFYLPYRFYKYLSRMMFGLGLLICFWVYRATISYSNNEVNLKSIEYLSKPRELRINNKHRLGYSTDHDQYPNCLQLSMITARQHVYNHTIMFLVNTFGDQDKSGRNNLPMHSYPKQRVVNSNIIGIQRRACEILSKD